MQILISDSFEKPQNLVSGLPTEPGETVSDIDHLINNIDSADMEDIVSCLAEKVKNLLQTEKVTGILAVLSKTAPSLLEILLPLLFADSEPTAPEWLSETTIDGIHNEEL